MNRKGNSMYLLKLGGGASNFFLQKKYVDPNKNIITLEDDTILQENLVKSHEYLPSKENNIIFIIRCKIQFFNFKDNINKFIYNLKVKLGI